METFKENKWLNHFIKLLGIFTNKYT